MTNIKPTIMYVFGNIFVPNDSGIYTLIPYLQQEFPHISFVTADPNENFPPPHERSPLILDTVLSITQPVLISLDDLAEIEKSPVSPHDYDLLFHLLLLKKLKKIDSARIVAIPPFHVDRRVLKKIIISIALPHSLKV